MIRRREFIAGLGGAAAWPLAASAQQPRVPVIGYLSTSSPAAARGRIAAFLKGLGEAGFVDGSSVRIEYQWADGQIDRSPTPAAELVRRQVAMIFADGLPAARAAKLATTAIPIVFVTGAHPVDNGLVASLNRPGANITGVTILTQELIAKRMELLHEIVPSAGTIGYLLDPTGSYPEAQTKDAETAARALGVQLAILNASTPSQIETALATLVERRMFVDAGGLMSYGASLAEEFRLAGAAHRLAGHLGGGGRSPLRITQWANAPRRF